MADTTQQANQPVGDVFELPGKSFRIVLENWKMFALVNILSLIAAVLSFGDTNTLDDKDNMLFNPFGPLGVNYQQDISTSAGVVVLIITLSVLVLSIFLYAMRTSLMVRTAHGEKPDAGTLTATAKKLWIRQLGLFIVMGLIILIGLILLIIPGIIAFGRIVFAPFLMFDRNLGIIDSIKASNEMVKGRAGAVWGAILLTIAIMFGVSFFSIIPVLGGLISTILTISFSMILALRYQELKTAVLGADERT